MQENSRPMAARVGALSATALLAVSGTFIAGPAMAGTVDPEVPPVVTEPAPDETTPAADPSTPAADPSTPAADPSTPAADPSTPAADPSTPAADPSTPAPGETTPAAPAPSASPTTQPLSAPTLSIENNSPVVAGQSITGTAPGATSLQVTWDGSDPIEVPVAEDGTFTITAPADVLRGGQVTLTLRGMLEGGALSSPSTYTLELLQENQLASPKFTSPSYVENSVSTISGTGTPGATINLNIQRDSDEVSAAAPVTVPVAEDGTWTLTLGEPLSYGVHSASAFQTQEGKLESPMASQTLFVAPSAPVFTTLGDGTVVPINQLPEFITGTGMPGADIEVVIDLEDQYEAIEGNPEGEIVVFEGQVEADGTWAVSTAGMTEGHHEILAFQSINGVGSEDAESNIIITAAVAADPADPANTGTGTITVTGNTGAGANLAETGAENVGVLAAGGAGLLAAGAAALFLTKRRRTVSDS